jgi:hypothetical protein
MRNLTGRLLLALSVTVLAAAPILAQEQWSYDCTKVDDSLARKVTMMSGDVYRFSMPRTD